MDWCLQIDIELKKAALEFRFDFDRISDRLKETFPDKLLQYDGLSEACRQRYIQIRNVETPDMPEVDDVEAGKEVDESEDEDLILKKTNGGNQDRAIANQQQTSVQLSISSEALRILGELEHELNEANQESMAKEGPPSELARVLQFLDVSSKSKNITSWTDWVANQDSGLETTENSRTCVLEAKPPQPP